MPGGGEFWDQEYSCKGRMWGGLTSGLPSFPSGSRILELGCGSGKTLQTLAAQELDLIAIDFSVSAASASRNLCSIHVPEIAVADARELPFRDETFDAVLAVHIIGHMADGDRQRGAAEIVRVLKREGTLIFRDFSVHDFRYGKGVEIEPATYRRGNDISTHYFFPGEVTGLFYPLVPGSICPHRWSLRVRGKDLAREEISGVFQKTP